MGIYGKKLINETIKCFKEEDGIDISEETTNEYLDNLGSLFLTFDDSSKIHEEKKYN